MEELVLNSKTLKQNIEIITPANPDEEDVSYHFIYFIMKIGLRLPDFQKCHLGLARTQCHSGSTGSAL